MMVQKNRVLVNALMSVAQVVVIGGTLFLLYRFLLRTIGIEAFGIWALVLSATSISSIANLGLAASTVKFVAQYLARGDDRQVVDIIQTAALSVGFFFLVILIGVYPLLPTVLALFLEPGSNLAAALSILPYALVSFWLTSVAAVFQSCIDGFQRVYLRNLLLMFASVVYLVLCYLMVPTGGLIGLAQAQVLQAGLVLSASWLVLKWLFPTLPILPYQWRRSAFTVMLRYSAQFQAISILHILFTPTAKMLAARFGGVEATGYFEMAERMVRQLRAVVVMAHQTIVPTIAELQERNAALLREIYLQSFQLILYLILLSLPLLIALTPIISRLWIGTYQETFVLFATLVFIGWFLNMLANPAYFANVGTGHLGWNVWGHVVHSSVNLGLGWILGSLYGGVGVVLGFVIAILAGSALVAVVYQGEQNVRIADLFPRESLVLGGAGLVSLMLAVLLYRRLQYGWGTWPLGGLIAGSHLLIVMVPLWRHSMQRKVLAWGMHLVAGTRRHQKGVL